MADIKGLIADPEFQNLSPKDKKQILSEADPAFGSLSDKEIQSFASVRKQREAQAPGFEATQAANEANRQANLEQVLGGIPFRGATEAAKQAYQASIDLAGDGLGGKILGAFAGGGAALGTGLNPLAKALSNLSNIYRASGENLASSVAGGENKAAPLFYGEQQADPFYNVPDTTSTAANLGSMALNFAQVDPANTAAALTGLIKGGMSPRAMVKGTSGAIESGLSKASNLGESIKSAIQKTPEEVFSKQAAEYRRILAPSKTEVAKLEIKSDKNINDYYKLASEEGLVIDKTPDGKLDTEAAREQIKSKIEESGKVLSDALDTQPYEQFDLNEIGDTVKSQLRKVIKNDLDYQNAGKIVDQEIEAAKASRGDMLSGSELNNFKQGMWSKSYDPLSPNSNYVARKIGFVAKDLIEKAYSNEGVKTLNKDLGDYMTLNNLLETAHNRPIKGGKIERFSARVIGGIAGHAIGVPVAGELGGAYLGGKIADFISNPKRATSKMAKKTEKIRNP